VIGTPAHDTARGATLLAEARKALGGDDKFKDVQALEVKGKSARAQQQATLQGEFEIQIEMPGKYRRKENLGVQDISIDIVQLVNGEKPRRRRTSVAPAATSADSTTVAGA
jgi:hypothetical protein